MNRTYLSPPHMTDLERSLLLEAFDSGWVSTAGPHLAAFEEALAERTGRAHAVALASGTAALHLGLLVAGVGPGDEVIMPTLTFAATANAVHYTGARPIFVDCNPQDWTLDLELTAQALEAPRRSTTKRFVMPVDLYGNCPDYEDLQHLCDRHGAVLVVDAAESVGSTRHGRPAGSFGLCAGLSFNGNKIVTTGGGGALVTDDGDLAERTVYLSTQAKLPGTAHYEHTEVGFNYRLSNLLAAVGLGQVRRLDEIVATRRAIRQRYARSLEAIEGVSLLGESEPGASNCWLTNIIVDPERVRATPPELAQALAAVDAESRPVFKPMHRQAVFAESPSYLSGCADAAFANGLTLPTGTELTEARQAQIIDVLVGTLTGVPV